MGYTILVKIESQEKRDVIYDFLEKNMKSFNAEVRGFESNYYGLRSENAFNKRTKKEEFFVGFQYNAGGPERVYIYDILRWLSYSLAKEKRVYYYDGIRSKFLKSEYAEIVREAKSLLPGNPKRTLQEIIETHQKHMYGYEIADKSKKFIEEEVLRLKTLWNK